MTTPDDPGAAVPGRPPAAVPGPHARAVGTIAGVVVTVVAIALAVAFGLARGDDPGRVVVQVVGLHDRPAPDPVPVAGEPAGFARRAAREGWLATGARTDRLEGREAVTVRWERAGRRIVHTTVSGDPVDAPEGARRTGRRGVLLRSFDADGRIAVTWTEGGRTAVISAIGVSRAALYDLAGGRALR